MKIKKIGGILAIVILVLGGNTITVSAKENTIPDKVIEISEGSDDIYGNGVPLDHTENPNARFKSGGIDHTHQYIVSNSVRILQNDKGDEIFSDAERLENLLYFTDWPDEYGNETDFGTFAGHFYNPKTGKNWMGQASPTAKGRAVSYFNEAVSAYNNGKIDLAIKYIGIGSHYVADLSEPHHTSDLTALNSNHTEFEKYVDDNRASYKINNYTINDSYYKYATDKNLEEMLESVAVYSSSLAEEAQDKSTYGSAAEKSVTSAIINVTQYFYKFAYDVGIY